MLAAQAHARGRSTSLVFAVFAAFASLLALPAEAHAETIEERRSLLVAAQVVRREGKLARARELFGACAAGTCNDAADPDSECTRMQAYCAKKRDEVIAEEPRVRVVVRDDRGLPLLRARVTVDRVELEGNEPLRIDPGRYVVRGTYAGREAVREVEARIGVEAHVELVIDLQHRVASRPIPLATWLLFGGSLAAIGIGTGLGVATLDKRADLEACRPTCPPDERASLEATTIGADVAFGVGIAAALGGLITLLARPSVTRIERLSEAAR